MTADAALAALALHDDGERKTALRVTRRDRTIVEGTALDIDVDSVTLLISEPFGHATVAHADIELLEMRVPDRIREWMMAVVGIVLATALLVGLRRLPVFGADVDVGIVMVIVYVLGTGLAPFLLARPRLGGWLQRWRPIFSARDLPDWPPPAGPAT